MGEAVARVAQTIYVPSYVVAFDPGGTTGAAVFEAGRLVRSFSVERDPPEDRHSAIWAIIGNPHSKVVVCEGYSSPRPLDFHGADTVMLIGWIRGCAMHARHPFVLQSAAAKKPFLETAAKLLDRRGAVVEHQRDAIAQGLAYIAKSRQG